MIFGITRITQLIMFDRILDAPRRRWLKLVNPHDYAPGDGRLSLLAYLSTCPFCMSFDVGLATVGLLLIPHVRDLVPIVYSALGAAFFMPYLDHWGDKALADKKLTPGEVAAWSHGGTDDEDTEVTESEGD